MYEVRRDRNYEQTTGTPSALSTRLLSSYPNDRNSDVLSLYSTLEISAVYPVASQSILEPILCNRYCRRVKAAISKDTKIDIIESYFGLMNMNGRNIAV